VSQTSLDAPLRRFAAGWGGVVVREATLADRCLVVVTLWRKVRRVGAAGSGEA